MISDTSLRGLERYILSDRNLQESLNQLPINSEEYLYLKLIHVLNSEGVAPIKDSQDLQNALQHLKYNYGTNMTQQVGLRVDLLSYDQAKDDSERKSILNTLKSFTSSYTDHVKPTNLKKIKKSTGDQSKGGDTDTSEEEDEYLKAYKTEYDSEKDFTRQRMHESLINTHQQDKIHQRYVPILDYTKMQSQNPTNYSRFLEFLRNGTLREVDFQNGSFQEMLKNVIGTFNYFNQFQPYLSRFSVKQLIQLYKENKQLQDVAFKQYITKQQFFKVFYDNEYETYTNDQKKQVLKEILDFVEGYFGKDQDLQSVINFMMLSILYKENQFDEKLFIQYGKHPHNVNPLYVKQLIATASSSNWNSIFVSLSNEINDLALLNSIIEANMEDSYIVLGHNLKDLYGGIYQEHVIERYQAQFNYLHNKQMEDTQVSKQVAKVLQDKAYIKLCHYNTKTFKLDQEIEVIADIKSIPKMQVKVFEINTDNYFRKNMSAFTSDINLDGLIAKYETEFDNSNFPSNQQHTEKFNFPQFNERRGLYVIEFIGNGMSSRAIIQKGNLSLIHRNTIAGQFCFILDENNEICKKEYTGLYFDNSFYQADKQNGRIIVPFGRNQYSGSAIMINEGFAQLTHFLRETEIFNFSASFILHNESVTLGNLAKILIKPQLLLNNSDLADLRLLENIKVTLQTVNQIDNITISKDFEDVKFNEKEEYEIEFQVPNNISSIVVSVSTQVNVASRSEKSSFSSSHTFNVNNHSHDYEFCEAFLRNIEDNYEFLIKGKNGEAKRGVIVDFQFKNKYYSETISSQLKTDKNGIIQLGKLRNITCITATPRQSRIITSNQKVWNLPEKSLINYPETLNILDSEIIKLPFKHKEIKSTNLSFIKVIASRGLFVENCIDKVKLIANKDNHYGFNYIQVQGLQDGQYKLNFKKEEVTVVINVHQGKIWNQNFILKENQMIERKRQIMDALRIDKVEISNAKILNESGESKTLHNVKVQLGGDFNQQNARIHAWAFQFFPTNLQQLVTDKLGFQPIMSILGRQFNFAQWKNIYLSNRALSDENRYILERKSQEKTIGNFLEKPTMLLKRNYVQDTSFNEEKLSSGDQYEKVQARMQQQSYPMASASASMQSNQIHRKRHLGGYPDRSPVNQNDIIGFQNFLQYSAETCLNVQVIDGQADFNIELNPYTTLLIVASSDDQFTHSVTSVRADHHIPQRDLSLKKPYNQEKSFSESRRTVNCLKYDSHSIEDITSTELQIVDSIEKVVLVQKELKKIQPQDQEFIEHLLKWSTYGSEKRAKVYSDFFSHEFNLFLKLKDPQYFDQVVKPFLINKIEKTFVDYWLLNYEDALEQYIPFSRFQELNVFEQCLLVQFLVKKGNYERAQEIFKSLENISTKPSQDIMNRIYDVVLNMNSLNSKPSVDDIQDQMKQLNKLLEKSENLQLEQMQDEDQYEEEQDEEEADMGGLFGDDDDCGGGGMECYMPRSYKPQAKQMMMMRSAAPLQDLLLLDFAESQGIRQTQKQVFKEIDVTKEYNETHYYKVKNRSEHKNLINPGMFWVELASHVIQQGQRGVKDEAMLSDFLSMYFTINQPSINESVIALALIDLPYKEESHGFKANEGRGVVIKAAGNMMLFLKEIQEAQTNINKDMLVVQRYFEKGKMEREVEEFLINEVYACQVVVTNISSKPIKFQSLVQIPEGSLPLNNSHFQKSSNHDLNGYQTMQFVFYFYFPAIGQFKHFPTNLSIDRVVVAKANPTVLTVRRSQTSVNEDDFDDVLATENIKDILSFMRNKNILDPKTGFTFDKIYCVNSFEESHNIFNFLDYYPLVIARAHRMGGMESSSNSGSNETKQWILNKNLRETYKNFVLHMLSKKDWSCHDRMMFVNYLLMQERVTEAIKEFRKIDSLDIARGAAQIQYDYLLAYLDFYECGRSGSTEFKDARSVVEKYSTYPVLHWRKLFKEMKDQLQEIDEANGPVQDLKQVKTDNFEEDDRQRKRKQVKVEPQLDFVIENKVLQIDYNNIENIRINYYQIDLEILFSKTPFLNSDTQDFSFVQPFEREELKLDDSQSNLSYPIPQNLVNQNLVIEVSNTQSGIKVLKTYYSANLKVRVIENFGELKVFVANEKGLDIPLPKTYVKVYQKKKNSGEIKFFKDGYTDLRGRFDYGQLSGTSISDVERFSIFVQNDDYGSLIKEAKPPSGLKQ
eukprot:403333486